jgi:hypothetical protein
MQKMVGTVCNVNINTTFPLNGDTKTIQTDSVYNAIQKTYTSSIDSIMCTKLCPCDTNA